MSRNLLCCTYVVKVRTQKKCNHWPSHNYQIRSSRYTIEMVLCDKHAQDLQQKNPDWIYTKLEKESKYL